MKSSTLPNTKNPTTRWIWLALLSAGLARFLNLGFPDLQAWDEALYTVRAQSIVLWGDWLDQTPHAIGGLYSSLHPPLQVWLTALLFKAFHDSEFTARIVPAFSGALTLPLIFLIGKEILGRRAGVIAALLFGLTPFVVFFTRQGQFDSLMTFFMTLSAYFIIKSMNDDRWPLVVLAGVATGFALMTKLFVALGIPLTYLAWILLSPHPQKNHWLRLALLTGVACIAAAPWHLYMTIQHGHGNPLFFFQQSAIFERAFSGVEGNAKPLEVLYYVNQLAVLFPFGVCWFIPALWKIVRKREVTWLFLALWFSVFFIVFSLMRTKLEFYLLPMLVPASLLAARTIDESMNDLNSKKMVAALISGTWITIVWSISQSWRTSVKDLLLSAVHLQAPPPEAMSHTFFLILLAIAGIALLILFYWRSSVNRFLPSLAMFLLIPPALISGFDILVRDRTQFKDGAFELAQFVQSHDIHGIVVAGFDRNPQLSYYLGGADLGWREDLHVRRIIPPQDTTLYRSWLEQAMTTEPRTTLLLLEKDKFIRYQIVTPASFVPRNLQRVFESRRYSGYLATPQTLYASGHAQSAADTVYFDNESRYLTKGTL